MSLITLYGHRGGGDPYPDASVDSFAWGANWGADSLEPDLYLTRDGVLVASHDNISQGFANVTYAEAKAMNPELLTFGEVIEMVKRFSIETGRDLGIIPELKDQSRAAAEALVRDLVAHDFTDTSRVVVQSFGSQNLIWLHDEIMPAAGVDFQLALLTGGISGVAAVAAYADIIAPSIGSFGAADVQAAHDAGLKVVAWTLTGAQSGIQSLVDMGVDGVFVDDTHLARPGEAAIEGKNVVYGAGQADTLADTAGNDIVYAMQGDDILRAGAGADTLYGDAGRDVLFGGAGDDTLVGGSGGDYLEGGAGADILAGSAGNDVIVASGDLIMFRPGDGIDLVVADGASALAFTGIASTGVTVTLDGSYLIIRAGSDAVVIRDGHDAAHVPGSIAFSDVTLTAAQLMALAVPGSDAAVQAALPALEYTLAHAPALATASAIAIGTDLVAADGMGNAKLSETVAQVEEGAAYRLSFTLADAGGSAIKVLWNGAVLFEGVPADGRMSFLVKGGSGDASGQLTFEGAAPGQFDATLSAVHFVKLADAGVPVLGNAAPVAAGASIDISRDLAHAGTVAASDADGDLLSYSLGDGPLNGTLTFKADSSYVYQPHAGYTGADGFSYIVNDGHGGLAEAKVDLTVKPGILVGADLILNGGFEDISHSTGTNGPSDWGYRNDGTPIAGWAETNSKRIEQHRDTYNGVSAHEGSYWIDLNGYNNNTSISQNVANVEVGATYRLSFSLADVDPTAGVADSVQVVWNGRVVWSGVAPAAGWQTIAVRLVGGSGDGSNTLTFAGTQPNPGATTYGAALDAVKLVKLADPGAAVPDAAPDAMDGTGLGTSGAPITGRLAATDTDGDVLSYSLHGGPAHGTVTVDQDGSYSYTSAQGYTGEDSFTFLVDDGMGGTDIATVTLAIDPPAVVHPNLIANGGFEDLTGANNAATWGYRNTSPAGVIAGWKNTSDTRAEVHRDTVGGISAKEGTYWFDMEGANNNATMVQAVSGVEQGKTYQLSFSIADTDSAQTDTIQVLWGSTVVYTGTPKAAWQTIAVDVLGGATAAANTLTFKSMTVSPNGAGVALDNIALVQIDKNPNLIVNGSFEDLTASTNTNGASDWGYRNQAGTMTGWTDANGNRIEQHRDSLNGVSAKDGAYLIDMDGLSTNTKMSQAVTGVEAGKGYDLTFSIADFDTAVSDDGIRVLWNGQVVYEGLPAGSGWQTITTHVVGGAGDGTDKLTFEATGTALNGYGVALDEVSLRASSATAFAGTAGAETLVMHDGLSLSGINDGGSGIDLLDYSLWTSAGVLVNLTDGIATGTGGIQRFENVMGSGLNDLLHGNVLANTVSGGAGDDQLYGWGGDDTLMGGAGNDVLYGGAGNDTVMGGAGDDTYLVEDLGDVIVENGGEGTDTAFVTVNGYTLGNNVEYARLYGAAVLVQAGDTGANLVANASLGSTLLGGAGADTLWSQGGNDTLNGGAGDDIIYGSTGNDRFVGGAGDDRMVGGSGADTFAYETGSWGYDQIWGFSLAQGDRLDFTGSGLHFADLVVYETGGSTVVAHGDDRIDLYNVTGLTEANFIFG